MLHHPFIAFPKKGMSYKDERKFAEFYSNITTTVSAIKS
jgi:hypothetical protein